MSDNVKQTEKAQRATHLSEKRIREHEVPVCDPSAYVMLHHAQTGGPCLTFDVVKDNLGNNRETFPLTCYVVCGTQSHQLNTLIVTKLSNLHPTDGNDDEAAPPNTPQMSATLIKHQGAVNRLKCTTLNGRPVTATWSELHSVHIWDLSERLEVVNDPPELKKYYEDKVGFNFTPVYTFSGHQDEGFALDWNRIDPGVLATGDYIKNIHVWHPTDDSSWSVDQRPLVGHSKSVEDIQWSPNEPSVLASCSVDRSIRIWDIRVAPSRACMLTTNDAHTSDVNCISWNRMEPFIVSGGDDGFIQIWDLRRFQDKTPVATFKHHTGSVTTVEWHPTDSAVFASGGSDNQIALWDLSGENDDEGLDDGEIEDLPAQLLFIHQGQSDIKELHWHPQIPGVVISTAANGFNIFKTVSI